MKKRLTILLAILLLFANVVTVGAHTFKDTAGKSCETAVYVLSSLGIVEGKGEEGKFEPDSPLTRAEMVTILLRTTGLPAMAGRPIFSDVPASHWAYANITTAYDMKLIEGISKTEFAPDSNVTYEQAMKMVVALLGYSVAAEAEGGFPAGYLSKGSQLDITRGVAQSDPFTRGDMAKLIFNALDTEMFGKTHYGNEAYHYDVNGHTLLTTYLKAYKAEKVTVAATPMAELSVPSRKLLSDEAMAGGQIYKQGKTNLQNMLGIEVDIYYRINTDTEACEAVAVVPSSAIEVIDVTGDKILSSTSNTSFVYEEADGTEEKIDITGATLVYNGRTKAIVDGDLEPGVGKVRLISNRDGVVETIIVESYVNAVVDGTNPEKDLVYFQDGITIDGVANQTSLTLDLKKNTVAMYDALGNPITLRDLLKWDVVSIAKNGDIIKVYRSYDVVEGMISEVYQSTGKVTIDGEKYPVAAPMTMPQMEIGKSAQFYLDFLGNIVAMDEAVGGGKTYGWLVSVAVKKGLGGIPQFKLFTEKGEMKVYDMGNKLTVGQNGTVSAKTQDDIKTMIGGGTFVPQLVIFKANDTKNILESITLAKNSTNEIDANKFSDNVFSMDYYIYKGFEGNGLREWNGTKDGLNISAPGVSQNSGLFIGSTLMAKIGIHDRMPLFTIPKNVSNDAQYSVAPMKTKLNYDSYQTAQYISLYDISEDQICGAAVQHNYITGTSSGGSSMKDAEYVDHRSSIAAVVKEVAVGIDADGMETTILTVFNKNGQEVSLIAPNNLQVGYIYASANFKRDPDWYTSVYNGTDMTARNNAIDAAIAANGGRRNTGMKDSGGDAVTMNILPRNLVPGDVIRYTAGAGNEMETAYVLTRVNYMAGGTFLYTPTSTWTPTPTTLYSGGGGVLLNGTVFDKNECGILVDTALVDNTGKPNGTNVRYLIPTMGQTVLWNDDHESMTTITTADIMPGDMVFSVWETNSQIMLVVYRDTQGIKTDWSN